MFQFLQLPIFFRITNIYCQFGMTHIQIDSHFPRNWGNQSIFHLKNVATTRWSLLLNCLDCHETCSPSQFPRNWKITTNPLSLHEIMMRYHRFLEISCLKMDLPHATALFCSVVVSPGKYSGKNKDWILWNY